MADKRSAWRANDIVTYDAAREAANAAIAAILRLAADGAILRERAIAEASAIRRELLEVDVYDRSALDVALERFRYQAAEYSGSPS